MNKNAIQNIIVLALFLACSPAFSSRYATDEFFTKNSAEISVDVDRLDAFICHSRQIAIDVVVVTGHADQTEKNALELSQRRAENFKNLLILLGLPKGRIYIEGKGAAQPASKDDNSLNRRVDVEAIGSTSDEPFKECDSVSEELLVAASRNKEKNNNMFSSSMPAAIAISMKRMDLLERFLTSPNQTNFDDDERRVLMRAAIRSGDTRFVERLTSFGIKITELTNKRAPIIWAVCETDSGKVPEDKKLQMVEALIAMGAKTDGVFHIGGRERSALQCAAQDNLPALVDLLLKSGANHSSPESFPPIFAGARHANIVRKLVAAGADAKARLRDDTTLFHEFRFSDPREVEWLVSLGLDINAPSQGGYTPLHMAVRYATREVLESFLFYRADINATTASSSLINGTLDNQDALVWLIDRGAPLTSRRSIIHAAVWKGDVALPVIEALHRRGANLRELDEKGNSPLRMAISAFAPELVQRLIDFGAIQEKTEATSLREFAETLQIRRRVPIRLCGDCFPSPGSYAREELKLNADDVLSDRQRKKNKIIDILQREEDSR